MPFASLLLPGCEKAPAKPDLNYVPPNSVPYTTTDGDSWWKLASRPDVQTARRGIDALGLCLLNFQTRSPAEINWYLRNKAGCTRTTRDRKNYVFAGGERIYLPHGASVPAGELPPAPLRRATVQAIINIVKSDAEAKRRIESMFGYLPGGAAGPTRNFLLALCDTFGFGKVKACDPTESNNFANNVVCTGISEAASKAILRRKASVPNLVDVGTQSRPVPYEHTAVLIRVTATGAAPADYVLDWWRSLDLNHPWVSTRAEFVKGKNGYLF